ncbi:transmembrane protein [Rhynchospora pubera]|uniref:Transmembrane protein n=1 Tax=Rhynchospora pubera TaxID=906938 RepID=A0AAV8CAL4_9POAL|nr:transmembrane protein [Rhynchospora pubera]
MAMHLGCGSLSTSSPLLSHAISSPCFSVPLFSNCFSAKNQDACHQLRTSTSSINGASRIDRKSSLSFIARSGSSSSSEGSETDAKLTDEQEFGYSRKDVLLIGVGVTAAGYGLKYGLELLGVDPLQAGNVVQLIIVLGMTIGWIASYMFRVANKDMTYAKQLKDYEKKVMEKRLESLSEAELAALLEQVEEEKGRVGKS